MMKQTKVNSIRDGRGGSTLAPETTMPAEMWDFVPAQVRRDPHSAQRGQAPGHGLRCYRDMSDASHAMDAVSNQAEDQRASVLMGALLGVTMFIAVLISGDFGDSDWGPTQRSEAGVVLSHGSASAPQH